MSIFISQKHPVRAKVASLGTHSPLTYYDEISHWWDRLVAALTQAGIPPESPDYPPVYNDEGRNHVNLANTDTRVYFAWYRMPVSHRYEIVCYLT